MRLAILFLTIISILILGAFIRWEAAPEPAPPYPDHVLPIGTNALEVGTLIWTPVNGSYVGRVEAVSDSHTFPNGTTGPAVLVTRDHAAVWHPRERMGHLVTERKIVAEF